MDGETRTTILDLLDSHQTMVLATVRDDGFPQATTMNYAHDDLTVYFWCDSKTQKARNLARNPKVSASLGGTERDWMKARGLSFGGLASQVTERAVLDYVMTLSLAKYPQMVKLVAKDFQHPFLFRIDVVAFTILDYMQGFGHVKQVVPDSAEAAGHLEWVFRDGEAGRNPEGEPQDPRP
jgi:general stress protein 26